MGFRIKAKLSGLDDVFRALRALKGGRARALLRKALTKGIRPVTKDVKRRAPKESGLLRRSIGTKSKTYSSGTVVVLTGPRTGLRQQVKVKHVFIGGKSPFLVRKPTPEQQQKVRDPAKYAHLVELGTVSVPAKPFIMPAWTAHEREAAEIVAREIREGLAKIAQSKG